MDLTDSPEQARFRKGFRDWLAANPPEDVEPTDMAGRFAFARAWQKRLYDGGWNALSWPPEYGGRGLGPVEEVIANEEQGRVGAPAAFPSTHLGRALLHFGSEEQKLRYLPGLLSAETVWCQGFSEPDAGSDLAAVRTTACRDGDHYVINGQKIWTSFGLFADMYLVLARTDPDAPRHAGISAFIVDSRAEGVTMRPIRLANGDEEFAEVFLDDVRVPRDALLGEPGQGWAIALATVAFERGSPDVGFLVRLDGYLNELVELAQSNGRFADPVVRDGLGRSAAELEVLRMHCLRRTAADSPGAESSIDKLLLTKVEQHLLGFAVQHVARAGEPEYRRWLDRYLYGRAASIYGGSAQIQRSILAERVLGLRFR